MGTWDVGTWDNDDAADWLADLTGTDDDSLIERSLSPQEVDGYYLEAPEGVHILCAAEAIAAVRGSPAPNLPEGVRAWATACSSAQIEALRDRAVQRIDRVLAKDSELHELWQENEDDYPMWKAQLVNLRARLVG